MPGDGVTPFRFSMAGSVQRDLRTGFSSAARRWGAAERPEILEAPGLVLATVAVNLITCVALLLALRKRLGELPPAPLGQRHGPAEWTAACGRSGRLDLVERVALAGRAAWPAAAGWPQPPPRLGLYGLLANAAGVPEASSSANRSATAQPSS